MQMPVLDGIQELFELIEEEWEMQRPPVLRPAGSSGRAAYTTTGAGRFIQMMAPAGCS